MFTGWIYYGYFLQEYFHCLKKLTVLNELTYSEIARVFISVSLLDWISHASLSKIANNECKHFTFKALVLFDLCFLFI